MPSTDSDGVPVPETQAQPSGPAQPTGTAHPAHREPGSDSSSGSRDSGTPARRGLMMWALAIAVVVLIVDQLTKYLAQQNLQLGAAPVPLIGDLLSLQLLYNPGAALSIATGMTWVLTIIVIVVVVIIIRMMRKIDSVAWAVSLGLILGGAIGNLADRIFREPGFARGHVVDFIDYSGFFVGNVADIAIVVGAVLFAILAATGVPFSGRRPRPTADEPGEQARAEDDSR